MKKYSRYGIYDFNEYAEELDDENLLIINGGASYGQCGGGAPTPSATPGPSYAPSAPSNPSPSSSRGPSTSPASSYGTCGGNVPSQNTPVSNPSPTPNPNSHSLNTAGCNGTPLYQVSTAPNDYHCDIYAWDLAIVMGLDPRNGKSYSIDLNWHTVSEMYNTYYSDSKSVTGKCPKGTSGMAFYDGTDDGVFNPTHVEYYDSRNANPNTYTRYATNGINNPRAENRDLDDPKNSNWTFVPL